MFFGLHHERIHSIGIGVPGGMDMTALRKCLGCLCGFVSVTLCGCVSTPSLDETFATSHSVKDQAVYCRLDQDAWYRVLDYDEAEVSVLDTAYSFSDIWYFQYW